MKVWTKAYRPFILGGDVHKPLACDIDDLQGPFDLGGGFQGFVIVAPSGKKFVVESTSGGIVGDSLLEVRNDIANGDAAVMSKQVADAIKTAQQTYTVSPQDFWHALRQLEAPKNGAY